MLCVDVRSLCATSPPPLPMSPPSLRPHHFLPPLPRENLFDPGCVFPADELRRRVLSLFWWDCFNPPYYDRAPAPVLERAGTDTDGTPPVLNVWWLTKEGVILERAGEDAPELRPYLPDAPPAERLWPRYDFRVLVSAFDVDMMFHRSALASQGHRTRLFVQPDGRVRVLARSPWWVG